MYTYRRKSTNEIFKSEAIIDGYDIEVVKELETPKEEKQPKKKSNPRKK